MREGDLATVSVSLASVLKFNVTKNESVSPSMCHQKYFQPLNRRVFIGFGDFDFFGVFRGVFGFSVFSPDDRIDNPNPPDVVPPPPPPEELDSKNDFDFDFIGLLFVTC